MYSIWVEEAAILWKAQYKKEKEISGSKKKIIKDYKALQWLIQSTHNNILLFQRWLGTY